jgi:hypothetical protein
VNDHEAMDAINAVLEKYFRAELSAVDALNQIGYISGANMMRHQEAKEQK